MIYNLLLLLASLIIYLSFGIVPFLFISFSTLSTFFVGKYLKNNKLLLFIVISINLSILIFFKFFVGNIINVSKLIVPIGISYYTLQVISYLVDVYKGKIIYEKNLLYYALYVMYLPHLYIGPISRYSDIKKELIKKKLFSWNRVYLGLQRISWGLIKKLIIAGRIHILINNIVAGEYIGIYVLIACLLYSIELYCDFSGGIDIVLGISKVLDIDLVENFKSPYLAESMKEFWTLWHISLSSWLRDYIYIPLGGNKNGNFRRNVNIIFTFIVSGLWHGLNYLLWGFINGILVILNTKYNVKNKWVNRIINYLIVSILWIFFIYSDTFTSLKMLSTIFNNFHINILNLGLNIFDFIILIIGIMLLIIYDINTDKINDKLDKLCAEKKCIILCFSFILIIIYGIYGIGFEANEFIYSRF